MTEDASILGTKRSAVVAASVHVARRSTRVVTAVGCLVILFWALFNDQLVSTPGLEWVPRIKLRMEFNSISFMVLFLPCTFALYALARRTWIANWVLALASLAIYATVGVIYLVPLLFTCLFDYLIGAYLARSADGR